MQIFIAANVSTLMVLVVAENILYLHPTTKKKRHDSEMEAFSSTSNISAKSLSNLTTKGSFGILRTS